MGGTQHVSVSEILSAWIAAIGRHASVCLLAGGLIAVVGTLMDITLGDKGGQIITAILSFFVGYHFVEYVLGRDFGTPTNRRNYLSAFGAALLALLGASAGLILLIVPGLYISARWSLANALVIGEGLGATDALRASWERTEGHVWTIVVCYVLLVLVFIGGAIGVGLVVGAESFAATLTGNVVGGAMSVVGGLLTCTLYGVIGKSTGTLDDVFS